MSTSSLAACSESREAPHPPLRPPPPLPLPPSPPAGVPPPAAEDACGSRYSSSRCTARCGQDTGGRACGASALSAFRGGFGGASAREGTGSQGARNPRYERGAQPAKLINTNPPEKKEKNSLHRGGREERGWRRDGWRKTVRCAPQKNKSCKRWCLQRTWALHKQTRQFLGALAKGSSIN